MAASLNWIVAGCLVVQEDDYEFRWDARDIRLVQVGLDEGPVLKRVWKAMKRNFPREEIVVCLYAVTETNIGRSGRFKHLEMSFHSMANIKEWYP